MTFRNPLSSKIAQICYPAEVSQSLQGMAQICVDRQFIFTTLNDFLQRHDRGYFTLVGSPGTGKTTILAKYLVGNPHILYYDIKHSGKHPGQFLPVLCNQLLSYLKAITGVDSYEILSNDFFQGSYFLTLFLQKISNELSPSQSLIIILDSLEYANISTPISSSNTLYLPRYLPPRVYFLISRRPFLPEKFGLLIETPSQILNLDHCLHQSRLDILSYLQHYLNSTEEGKAVYKRIKAHHVSESEFYQTLATISENNFMHLSTLLSAIARGTYAHPLNIDHPPPELEHYYHQQWKCMRSKGLPAISHNVLCNLTKQKKPVSAEEIAAMLGQEEYKVEIILEGWIEFLNPQFVQGKTFYNIYHSSFRNFLAQQLCK